LVDALKEDEPVPARARAYIASLLTGAGKKRGRRAVPRGEHPAIYPVVKKVHKDMNEVSLIFSVRDFARDFRTEKDPVQAAIMKIARVQNRAPATVRRYYTKACARHPWALEDAKEIK
jgi:hypothetical protein